MPARVILIAGPSGAGKTHLAERSGLPIIQLDDYYRDGDDPALPHFESGAVDWDHVDSWDREAALAGVRELCETGRTDAPDYDISANARVGHHVIDLDGATSFIAEGIFAAELVGACKAAGMPTTAICVRRSRWVTFGLRLSRDLREHRKPPLFLLKRGWYLARQEPSIVAALVTKGCTAMTPREAADAIRRLSSGSSERHTQA